MFYGGKTKCDWAVWCGGWVVAGWVDGGGSEVLQVGAVGGGSPQGLTDRSRLKRLRGWMCAHVQGGLSSMSSPSPLTSLHLSCYSAQPHVWQMGEGKPSIIVIICFYPALSA